MSDLTVELKCICLEGKKICYSGCVYAVYNILYGQSFEAFGHHFDNETYEYSCAKKFHTEETFSYLGNKNHLIGENCPLFDEPIPEKGIIKKEYHLVAKEANNGI